ncbi:MAG: glycosyltransferase [Bacteroidetes bacterium]|nr:glycosyltransferase [Bacteroidota bacterium]
MSKKPRILYLSYDGLTDPLGQSQILAYLSRINRSKGIEITIISFDKPDVFLKNEKRVREILSTTTIQWHPLVYHKSPPVLSTIRDLRAGWKKIKELYRDKHFDIVHCRGYISAILGQKTKKKFNAKFIFDMRGWWPDEKLESGLWGNPVFKPVYKYFKKKEQQFFQESDITVSLTYAGKKEIVNHFHQPEKKIGVIPTCVDFDVFKAFDEEIKKDVRQKLGIPLDAYVVIYSGSIGANYPPKDILKIYQSVTSEKEKHLLILSREPESLITNAAAELNINEKIHFASADYNKVHLYLQASDLGIILYKMAFSTIGRSPTKLGEYWACGIPSIAINNIGDLNYISEKYDDVGLVLVNNEFNSEVKIPAADKALLRENALSYFDINSGVEFYTELYFSLYH